MIRLYITLGILAVLAVGGAAIYAKGQIDARHAVEVRTLRDNITRLQADIESERKARIADAIQAKVDREEAEIIEQKIKEMQDALSDPDRECFGADDADRLRALIENKR